MKNPLNKLMSWAGKKFFSAWIPRALPRLLINTNAGVQMSEDRAMLISAVHCAVQWYRDALSMCPLHLRKRINDDGESVLATDHPLYSIMAKRWSPIHTSSYARSTAQAQIMLWGNHYGLIHRDPSTDRVTRIVPTPSGRIQPRLSVVEEGENRGEPTLDYFLNPVGIKGLEDQTQVDPIPLERRQVLHIPGMSFNGLVGVSIVAWAAQSFGVQLAREKYSGSLFNNDGIPAGLLSTDKKVDQETADEYVQRYKEQLKDPNSLLVLGMGMRYDRISMPPEEAQFIESQMFGVREIARWFKLRPRMLGAENSEPRANAEQDSLDFVTHSVVPWIVNWEDQLSMQLLAPNEREEYFFEFDIKPLLRGDAATLHKTLASGRQWGYYSANDCRRVLGLSNIGSDGDIYLQPVNMIGAGDDPFGDSDDEESKAEAARELVLRRLIRRAS